MNPQDLFGVLVRTLGLVAILQGLRMLVLFGTWHGMLYVLAGVLLIVLAGPIVTLCYTNVVANLIRRPRGEATP